MHKLRHGLTRGVPSKANNDYNDYILLFDLELCGLRYWFWKLRLRLWDRGGWVVMETVIIR